MRGSGAERERERERARERGRERERGGEDLLPGRVLQCHIKSTHLVILLNSARCEMLLFIETQTQPRHSQTLQLSGDAEEGTHSVLLVEPEEYQISAGKREGMIVKTMTIFYKMHVTHVFYTNMHNYFRADLRSVDSQHLLGSPLLANWPSSFQAVFDSTFLSPDFTTSLTCVTSGYRSSTATCIA